MRTWVFYQGMLDEALDAYLARAYPVDGVEREEAQTVIRQFLHSPEAEKLRVRTPETRP